MIQRLCPRCRTVLHLEDETSLVYCYNCSAPQVRLSQDLLDQSQAHAQAKLEAAQTPAQPTPTDQPPAGFVPPVLNRWTGAIQCAGLAGAVAAGLTLVSFALPPVALLTLCWIVSAPIVILGIYASRFQNTRITAGFAARLGVLCAVAILVCILSLDTIHLCLDRFLFHAAAQTVAQLDTQLTALFAQQAAVLNTNLGPAQAKPFLDLLAVPDFRAGLLLSSFAMLSALYLLYSAAAGAFAGLFRSKPTTR